MTISININTGILMGEIISTFRKYSNEKEWGVEFDIKITNYIERIGEECVLTCMSTGVQAELIVNQKSKGDHICITGYIADSESGSGSSVIGKHKFRITGVHFKNLNYVVFAGKILSQPSINEKTGVSEFHLATYRTHKNMPLDPCKIKVICQKSLADIMQSFSAIKSVGEHIEVLGFLRYENGSHVLHAKRIELLLDEQVKNRMIKEIAHARQNAARSDEHNDKPEHGGDTGRDVEPDDCGKNREDAEGGEKSASGDNQEDTNNSIPSS